MSAPGDTRRPDPPALSPDIAADFRYEPFHHEAGDFLRWSLERPGGGQAAIRCRYVVGPDRRSCKKPAAAWLDRGTRPRHNWWAYCGEHMYGAWIEGGKLWRWRLVPVSQQESVTAAP